MVGLAEYAAAGQLRIPVTASYRLHELPRARRRLAFPARRRVYRRNPDGTTDRRITPITLDIHDIAAA